MPRLRRPARPRQSITTSFTPAAMGWTEVPDVLTPPASIVSGQNVWARRGRAEPRFRFSQVGTNNPTVGEPHGAFFYDDLAGARYPMVTSAGTVAYLDSDSWITLTFISSVSNLPPTGDDSDLWFGTSSYLTRADLNVALFTNGVNPVYAWGGPSDNTGYSILTGGPICKDLTVFDDRVVGWNIRELSSSSRLVTRAQWSIAGGPETWTGIGAGFQDLLHMRGVGTRIFATEDQMLLASDREIWRGRRIGAPFYFDFSPISKELGMPYPSAAIQTPVGIFWLGSDYMVYHMEGERITPVGEGIQRTLRDTAVSLDKAFFGYSDELQQLTLYYTTTASSSPQRGFTLHLDEGGVWTPHRYAQQLTIASEAAIPSTSASTWGGLVGALSAQGQSYNESLGGGGPDEMVLTSTGTAYYYSSTNSLDETQVVTCQILTGNLWPHVPERMKFLDRVRLDARATSASSLTIGVSGNLGGSISSKQAAISVQSNSTQQSIFYGINGTDHSMEFRSDDTGWQIYRVIPSGRVMGETC